MALFQSRHLLTALPMLAAVVFGPITARADEPEPYETLKANAEAVLEKHCARCHQEGKLAGRDKSEKGFGNVLHLDEMLRNPALIKPGVPEGSKIYNMMVNSQMPYDVFQEFSDKYPEPTKDEVLAVRKWITAAKVTCSPSDIVSSADILKYVADDLRTLQKSRIANTRYITLANYTNGCTSDEHLEVYRQGVVKFLNSMSRISDVVKLETADPAKTIIRFNLSDLGWTPEDWEMLAAVYPYSNYPDDPLYKFVTDTTYTAQPYMRADWLIFNAAQPPFYEKLLRLPTSYVELQKKLAIDVDANISAYRVARAGFQESGVSQHNRLIERHTIATGYFWTSYDFGGDSDEQSFFAHPTGPHGHDKFTYDGGETIFSLPNGFQAYGLYTAKGASLDKGPTNIVRDPKRRDQAVANGISCMGCHDQGIKLATDQVREHVLGAKSSYPKAIRDAVKEMYPEKSVMDQLMAQDAKRFYDAQIRAGLNPALELNGDEPINAVSRKYELPVDLTQAAAELGISVADMERDLTGTDAAVVRRLKLGSLPRQQFETAYAGLVKVLTEDVMIASAKPAHDAGGKPVAAVVKPAEMAKPGADPAGTFTIEADKATYYQNDVMILSVSTSQDCFLTLVNVDGHGKGTIIFPNKFQTDNRIGAGKVFRFGGEGAPFRLRLADKGTETIIAECSTKKGANPDVAADYKAGGFTDLGDYVSKTMGSFGARAIKVEAAKGSGGQAPAQIKQEVADLGATARTAIKVEVK